MQPPPPMVLVFTAHDPDPDLVMPPILSVACLGTQAVSDPVESASSPEDSAFLSPDTVPVLFVLWLPQWLHLSQLPTLATHCWFLLWLRTMLLRLFSHLEHRQRQIYIRWSPQTRPITFLASINMLNLPSLQPNACCLSNLPVPVAASIFSPSQGLLQSAQGFSCPILTCDYLCHLALNVSQAVTPCVSR